MKMRYNFVELIHIKRAVGIEMYKVYAWVWNVVYGIMELLPLSIRTSILKIALGHLGKSPALIDYKTYFRYPKKIEIGSYVAINRGCMFLASIHSSNKRDIIIGNHCVFAPNVKLLSAGHDYHKIDLPDTNGQIVIGDYVWVGEGATVLQGIKIGEGG